MGRPARQNLKKVNLHMDVRVLQGFHWLADSRGTSTAELLRSAAKEYLLRELRTEQEDISVLSKVSNA